MSSPDLPEIVYLNGVRFVRTCEPQRGEELADAQIKALTSGAPVEGALLPDDIVWFDWDGERFSPIQCGHDRVPVTIQPAALTPGMVNGVTKGGSDHRVEHDGHVIVAVTIVDEDVCSVSADAHLKGHDVHPFHQRALWSRRGLFEQKVGVPLRKVSLRVSWLGFFHRLLRSVGVQP